MSAARAAIALVLLVLAAGCLGKSDAPTASASVKENETATSAAAPNMTDLAPNVTSMPIMTGMFTISYKGTSPQGVCSMTGTPADQCQMSSPGAESFHKVDYKGAAQHVTVTITYGDLQPSFHMYAALCVGKPGATVTSNDCHDYKTAASPMKLDADLANAARGAPIGISIGAISDTPAAAAVLVFSQADFKVDGHLMASI